MERRSYTLPAPLEDGEDALVMAVIKQAVKDLRNPLYTEEARLFLASFDLGEEILRRIDEGWQVHI